MLQMLIWFFLFVLQQQQQKSQIVILMKADFHIPISKCYGFALFFPFFSLNLDRWINISCKSIPYCYFYFVMTFTNLQPATSFICHMWGVLGTGKILPSLCYLILYIKILLWNFTAYDSPLKNKNHTFWIKAILEKLLITHVH